MPSSGSQGFRITFSPTPNMAYGCSGPRPAPPSLHSKSQAPNRLLPSLPTLGSNRSQVSRQHLTDSRMRPTSRCHMPRSMGGSMPCLEVPCPPCLQPNQLGVYLASSQSTVLDCGALMLIATGRTVHSLAGREPTPSMPSPELQSAACCWQSQPNACHPDPPSRQVDILPLHPRPTRRPRPQHAAHASAGATCPNPSPLAAALDEAHSPRSLLHGPATCRFRCGC